MGNSVFMGNNLSTKFKPSYLVWNKDWIIFNQTNIEYLIEFKKNFNFNLDCLVIYFFYFIKFHKNTSPIIFHGAKKVLFGKFFKNWSDCWSWMRIFDPTHCNYFLKKLEWLFSIFNFFQSFPCPIFLKKELNNYIFYSWIQWLRN